jgi:hypothetical protein
LRHLKLFLRCAGLNYLGFFMETGNLKELPKPLIPGQEAGKPKQRVDLTRTAETIASSEIVLNHQLLKSLNKCL